MPTDRVKYSHFSNFLVRALGKFNIAEVEVEATSHDEEKPSSERAFTDKKGNFRIMGLVPGVTYDVQLKEKSGHIIIPENFKITMKEEEQNNVSIQGLKLA